MFPFGYGDIFTRNDLVPLVKRPLTLRLTMF